MIPVRVYAYIAIAAAIIGGLFWVDHRAYQRGEAHEHVKTLVAEANAQKAIAAAQESARAVEAQQVVSANKAAESYEMGKRDVQVKSDKLVADLRSGTERLRKRWQGSSDQCLRNLGASAAELDAAKRDREESVSRAIRAAADADAQIAGLQAFIIGEREAWNKQGVKR